MTKETQTLVRYDMEEDATHGVVALQRPDGIWVHYDAAAAALTALARDMETARQQNAALAEPALMGNCYKAERDACRAARAALQADLAAARQERDAALAERNAARARAADSQARLAAASVHEARAIAAVRAARAETWAAAAAWHEGMAESSVIPSLRPLHQQYAANFRERARLAAREGQ